MCISRTTTSKTVATFKPSAHLWRFRTTREFDNKNKARRESLRGPRDGQSVFGNACGSSANRKKNVLALAEVPQIKKRTLWRLRKFRKSKRERFGVCGTPANQKKNVLAFAEVPRGIPKSTLAVTALYPSHSSGIRSLILSFKLTLQRFLEREIRRRGHPFRSDRSLGGHTLLRSISEVPI